MASFFSDDQLRSLKTQKVTPSFGPPFSTIVADPPWPYKTKGPVGNGGRGKHFLKKRTQVRLNNHYGVLSIPQLCSMSVKDLAAKNSHLYLWVTNNFIAEGLAIVTAWGFTLKTIITWGKVCDDRPGTPSMRTGFYYRGATEHCLFAVRGKLRLSAGKPESNLHLLPRLSHSVKPDYFYELIMRNSPGPYLEIFARRPRKGWDYFGNEVNSTVQIKIPKPNDL